MHTIYYELVIRYAYSNVERPEEELQAEIGLLEKLEQALETRQLRSSGPRHNYDLDVYLSFTQLKNKLYDAVSQALYDSLNDRHNPAMAASLHKLRQRVLSLNEKEELDRWVEEAWDVLKTLGLQ